MKSLRSRLVIAVMLLVAVLGGGLAAIAWREVVAAHRRDMDQLLRDKASILAKSLNRENPREVFPMVGEMQRQELGFYGQGFDTNRNLLWKSDALDEPLPLSEVPAFLAWNHLSHRFDTCPHPTLGVVRVVTYPVWEMRNDRPVIFAFVQTLKPLAETRRNELATLGWMAGAAIVATLLAGLATHFLITRWWAATAALADTARAWGQGDTVQRLPVPGQDPEAAAVAQAFNSLLERLEGARATERQFIADASHELRTPLTILRGEIDVILRRDRAADEYRAVLLSNREEIERLSHLTENLLVLARADAGEAKDRHESVDLGAIAGEVVSRLTPVARARTVDLRAELETPHTRVAGHALELDRALFNLVENAVRHSPAEEEVLVRIGAEAGAAVVSVTDHGRGIAAEHLPRLFDRFYRVDAARDRAAGGAGLGLAIVKSIIVGHGGSVGVHSVVGRGTTFTVRLPMG
jgi:heavy metal sensor kinase